MYGSGAGWLPRNASRAASSDVTEIHPEWNPDVPGAGATRADSAPDVDALASGRRARRRSRRGHLAILDGDADRLRRRSTSTEHFVDQLRTIRPAGLLHAGAPRGDRRPAREDADHVGSMLEQARVRLYDVPVRGDRRGHEIRGPDHAASTNAVMGGEESGGYVFSLHMCPSATAFVAGLYLSST